jgi:hypothetical protein
MSDRSLHAQQLPAGRRPVAPQRRRPLLAAATAVVALLAAVPGFAAAPGFGTAPATQYALIVNGDDSFTHNYNVSLALASLRQLGYAPQNTLTLAPASLESSGAAVEPATWRRPATEQGLRQALALLRGRVRPGDLLLVYLTGHGYRMFGRTSLGLQDGSITARDLMQQLGEIPFGKLVMIADQCYSGGFSNAAVALGRNVVAVSSTDDRHEVRCEPFIRPLWLAAVAAESDTRGNGFVSIEEAFQVAISGLARAGAAAAAESGTPQLATSGTCAGRENRFSPAPLYESAQQQALLAH